MIFLEGFINSKGKLCAQIGYGNSHEISEITTKTVFLGYYMGEKKGRVCLLDIPKCHPHLLKELKEELPEAKRRKEQYLKLKELGISEKNVIEAYKQNSLEEAIDYLKKRGKYW